MIWKGEIMSDDTWDTASSLCLPPTPPAHPKIDFDFDTDIQGQDQGNGNVACQMMMKSHTSLLSLSELLGDDWERLALHLHFS